MDRETAIDAVLELLRRQGKATDAQMLRLLENDADLLREVRESLILDDLAADKNGVGLVLLNAGQAPPPAPERAKLFLSYGRRDAKALADRLAGDLKERGYDVWLDTREIVGGTSWQHEIVDGLRSAQVVVALLSPHSVRTSDAPESSDGVDSVCLGEIAYALFQPPPTPVLPVMAEACEPPLAIFHLDYVDLTRWRDSEERYQEGLTRLIDGIEASRQGKKRYRSWHRQLQPWDFAAFLHEKRRDFTGRRWLFDEIDAWRASSADERALLVTGDPGTGKSAVVAELVHRNPGGQVIAYHCCQADTPATLEAWRFVRSVAAMIASRLPEYEACLADPSVQEMLAEENCRSDPAGAFERGVLAPLETVPAPVDGVRYLLVDALDEALTLPSGLTIVQLLASRIHRLPAWLRVVATTRKEPEVLNRLRGLRAQELDAQDARNLEDVASYVRRRLAEPNLAAAVVASGRSAESVFDSLAKRSDGNFLYARQALDGLGSGLYSVDELDSLPSGLYALYDANFRRQFGQRGEAFAEAKRILETVVAAQEPLTSDELAEAAGLDPRREIPAVLNRLAAFVPGRRDGAGVVRFSVFHKSLTDWLTAEDLLGTSFSVLPEDGHRRLAAIATTQHARGAQAMSSYSLRHGPHHLVSSRSWDDLDRLLTDLSYLERRNAADQLVPLALDFDAAYAASPTERPLRPTIKLLGEALRRDLRFVARHATDYPQGLFQSLWNSGWWYDSPNAEMHYEAPEALPYEPAPWEREGPKLFDLLERWRSQKERETPGFVWLRALRPPRIPLGSGLRATLSHDRTPCCATFSDDGKRVFTATGGAVFEWDVESGAELRRFEDENRTIRCLALHPDGRRIVCGYADGTIVVRDRATGVAALLQNVSAAPVGLTCSPDGKLLAAWSHDAELLDLESGRRIAKWNYSAESPLGTRGATSLGSVHFRSDELHAYDRDGGEASWNWRTGETRYDRRTERRLIATSASGRTAWRVGPDRIVVSDERGEPESQFPSRSYQASFSSDGRRLATYDSDSRIVRVWDLERRRQVYCVDTCIDLSCVSLSPDGRTMATGGSREDTGGFDKSIGRFYPAFVWDLDSEPFSRRLFTHSSGDSRTDAFDDLIIVPAADRVVTANGGSVQTWDMRDGSVRLTRRLGSHLGFVRAPGRPEFVGISWNDRTNRVYDARSGEAVAELPFHWGWRRFACDGRFFVQGDTNGVRIWETARWEEICPLPGDACRIGDFMVFRDLQDQPKSALHVVDGTTAAPHCDFVPSADPPPLLDDPADPFLAVGETGEWLVVRAGDPSPLARVPTTPGLSEFDAPSRLLAAASFDHLALYRLEGDLPLE